MRKQKAKIVSKGEGELQNKLKGGAFATQPGFKRVDEDTFTFQHGRTVRDGPGLILCFGSRNRTLASAAQPASHLCQSRANQKPFQQIPRCFWRLFVSAVHRSLRVPGAGVEIALQSPRSPKYVHTFGVVIVRLVAAEREGRTCRKKRKTSVRKNVPKHQKCQIKVSVDVPPAPPPPLPVPSPP